MRYLSEPEIIALNVIAIQKESQGEMIGVKNPSLLNSAVYRPQQTVYKEDAYGNLFEKATALFESIAKSHCFYSANKRTAFLALLQILAYNNYKLVMEEKEAVDFVVDVVNHKYNFEEIAEMIKTKSFPRN